MFPGILEIGPLNRFLQKQTAQAMFPCNQTLESMDHRKQQVTDGMVDYEIVSTKRQRYP